MPEHNAATASRSNSLFEEVIEDCAPAIRQLASGRYAIAVGGSLGKGTWDANSDLDFRLYYVDEPSPPEYCRKAWERFSGKMAEWRKCGVTIDSCWARRIEYIDSELAKWVAGVGRPEDLEWTIWGYHILPDIYYQRIIEDPFGVLAGWKGLLSVYPKPLKAAIIKKHMSSLRYWRQDYHYEHKVQRRDAVFLAGISARLAHDLLQVIFAVNETYFPGDGSNLDFAESFRILPHDFAKRLNETLYPVNAQDQFAKQRQALLEIIADVESLLESAGIAEPEKTSCC